MRPLLRTLRYLAFVIIVVGLGAAVLLCGPLFPFEPAPSSISALVEAAPDLDRYLREREARHPDIKPDQAKTILWSDPSSHRKTALALVYLHGFSASRRDISPVIETLADGLHANAFLARLTAHGLLSPEEFATVTPQNWLDDAREALAIGKRLGDRVVLIGTSTGALLATMAALEDHSSQVAALILLSPNFGIRDRRAQFISGPFGRRLARLVIGEDYAFEPATRGHAEFWTTRYPSQAVVALMDLVNRARSMRLADLKTPTLVIYTDQDIVVDPHAIRDRFAEIGAARKEIVDLPEANRHELTGDALAPDTVAPVLARIETFLAGTGIGVADIKSP
jgi:alpha-beta hydrolase superfamily lysophospholipase